MARRTPTEKRQRDPERTRQRIVAAATKEFARNGYAGARVGAIAERAAVNKQLISYYFGGKEGLYREIADRWLTGEQEARERSARMSLGELTASYLFTDPDLVRLFLREGLADTAPADPGGEAADPGGEARDARMADAVRDLERRQADGELDPELDPRAFLLALMGATLMPAGMPRLARSIYGAETEPESEEFRQQYAAQLERIVRRLGAESRRDDAPRAGQTQHT